MFYDADIPKSLYHMGKDTLEHARALMILSRYSLVDAKETTSCVPDGSLSAHSMHPVLHQWCKHLSNGRERAALVKYSMGVQHNGNSLPEPGQAGRV
jgi:hypothetical protein